MVDNRGFGMDEKVPIKFSQYVTPKDKLLENSDLGAYSS